MVSLEAYRARIGMFNRAGKSSQSSGKSFDASIFEKDEPDQLKLLKINRKYLCSFALALLSLLFLNNIGRIQSFPQVLSEKSSSSFHLSDQEHFPISDTILDASVLAVKLIIGNVEANPGPMDLKEFFAFLFVDAEDPIVKDVLKEIKAAQDKQTNLKKVKSKTVDALKATLAYLNDWNKDDENIKMEIDVYTKEGIAHLLIKKIYNMAPQKCATCLKTSHFKPGEFCVLSCIRCNRGACVNCYELEREKLKSLSMFNRSIFFSCENCTSIATKENSIDESHKKKSCGKKKSPPVDNSVPNPDLTDNLTDAIGRLSVNEESETIDLVTDAAEDIENDEAETSNPTEHEDTTVKEGPSTPEKSTICWFYKQNKCKFGMSGKGCKFHHPKICQKLLSHGTQNQKGCQKAGKCKFFHPAMCRNSIRKRLCTNQTCEFMHIRGTKRFESTHVKDARETLDRLRNTSRSKKNQPAEREASSRMEAEKTEKQASHPFLEMGPNQKPPTQEAGIGYGGDQTLKLMELLQKLVMMQTQQLQLLQHPQMQVSPQMTLQTQLPVIQQQRNLHF